MTKSLNILLYLTLASLITSCGGYPRLLSLPYDNGGRNINSSTTESFPQIAPPYIIFIADRNGSQVICLYDLEKRRLVEVPGLNFLDAIPSSPSISEDHRYIIFAATRNGRSAIYFYDRQTQQKRNLTQNLQAEVRNPSMTADGSKVVYERAINGRWEIAIIDTF